MCGIAGFFAFNGGRPSEAVLRTMTDRMIHRGPDDDGFVLRGPCGLGMRRLSIIDVGGGHQPLTNEAGDLHLVLNGEIYNHVELRAQLQQRGHVFRTHSDAEVVLHLYEELGQGALAQLNGMFAFALYDARSERLWLVRDRIGIKPLFFAHTPEGVLFASDVRAMQAVATRELSHRGLLDYLAFGYVPAPRTVWEGIAKLPPAHFAWVSAAGLVSERYWSLPAGDAAQRSDEDAVEYIESLLVDSVRLQLRADVPVGVFLSGGVDSSALVSVASEQTGVPLRTFTVVFDGKVGAEDADFARLVASQYGTVHTEIPFAPQDAMHALDDLLSTLDEPLSDSAILPSYVLSNGAKARGIKVLLSGAGGDEAFCGYGRHFPATFPTPRWVADTLPKVPRALLAQLWAVVQPRGGLRAVHPAFAWAATVNGLNLQVLGGLLRDRNDFRYLLATLRSQFGRLEGRDGRVDFERIRMRLDLETYLPDNVLALTDKATMAASVEGRVPLLDHRIVEATLALTPAQLKMGGGAKGMLKSVLRRRLPSKLLSRRKEGFNAPVAAWIDDPRTFNVRDELLDNLAPTLESLFDPRSLERATGATKRSHAEHTIFGLYILNRWIHAQRG